MRQNKRNFQNVSYFILKKVDIIRPPEAQRTIKIMENVGYVVSYWVYAYFNSIQFNSKVFIVSFVKYLQ